VIAVKVRCLEQEESVLLGLFTPGEVLQIPNLFKTFPSFDFCHSEMYLVAAQFVIDANDAFFEIVVEEASE